MCCRNDRGRHRVLDSPFMMGLTWIRQREIVATATGKAKDLILAKSITANDELFALAA